MAAWEEQVVPVEGVASRLNRDLENRGGDVQATPTGTQTGWTGLTLDADGRNDREYDQRGGDFYQVNADGEGWSELDYDPDGRNSREYADKLTLVSELTNKRYADADSLRQAYKD